MVSPLSRGGILGRKENFVLSPHSELVTWSHYKKHSKLVWTMTVTTAPELGCCPYTVTTAPELGYCPYTVNTTPCWSDHTGVTLGWTWKSQPGCNIASHYKTICYTILIPGNELYCPPPLTRDTTKCNLFIIYFFGIGKQKLRCGQEIYIRTSCPQNLFKNGWSKL